MTSERTDRAFEQDAKPSDRLEAVDLLTRREIEARIIIPLLEAFGEQFGRERVLEIARLTIVRIAQEQGEQLAGRLGGNTLAHFATILDTWNKNDALQIEMLEQSEGQLSFDVTRCRYAEMYRELGVPELGVLLSCNRDFALIEGFNPGVSLTRKQTIMEGAPTCDFRFEL